MLMDAKTRKKKRIPSPKLSSIVNMECFKMSPGTNRESKLFGLTSPKTVKAEG